jgi:hypothetical protein
MLVGLLSHDSVLYFPYFTTGGVLKV